jgi:biotin carboxyl carrier protein
MKVVNAVKSEVDGTVVEVMIKEGEDVLDDDVLFKLS